MSHSNPVQRLSAIALTVSNVDRSQAFYRNALGFELVSDSTVEAENSIANSKIRIATLRLGDEQIKLMQYLNLEGKPIPKDSQSNDLWFQHMAIVVRDFDRAYDHLKQFAFEPISTAPQTIPQDNSASAGVRAFKFKDPDRHNLELIWFPPDKGQSKWHRNTDQLFLGIDHTAIAVADTEQSLHFYRDRLGMQVKEGSLNQGETQARLDGLPEAKVQVTDLRPAQGGLGIELLDYLIPEDGRAIPSDWRSCDLAYMQIEVIVNQMESLLEQLQITNSVNEQSVVKDPTGHSILLTSPKQ
ncbi:VOC family protein [Pseudanabaenaceae cyanobacterium LEGE 13415]|nr:VOC family protein [Pseudanabaenaceae cyanobacterium LEGE 13415]